MADIAHLAVEVDSKSIKNANKNLDDFVAKASKAQQAADKLAAAWNKNANGANNTANVTQKLINITNNVNVSISKVSNTLLNQNNQFNKVSISVEKTSGSLNKLNASTRAIGRTLNSLKTAIVGLFALMTAGVVVKQADEFNQLQAKIKNSLDNASQFPGVFDKLIASSDRSGTSIDGVAQAFVRIKPAAQVLGVANEDLIKFNETYMKLGAVSGATAEEMKYSMIQMAQAIGSNKLQGDELRSVMENMPRLARTIAASMGIPFENFKKAASEGKVTAEEIFKAILKQADDVDSEFAKLPVSVSRSMNVLQTSWLLFIGSLNKAVDGTTVLGGAVVKLANTLRDMGQWIDANSKQLGGLVNGTFSAIGAFLNFVGLIDTIIFKATGMGKVFEMVWGILNSGPGFIANLGVAFTDLSMRIEGVNYRIKEFIINYQHSIATLETKMKFGGHHYFGEEDAQKKTDDFYNAKMAKMASSYLNEQEKKKASIVSILGGYEAPKKEEDKKRLPNIPGSVEGKKDKNAEKLSKFINEINAETTAQKRLMEALNQGIPQYEHMKDVIEAENRVRQTNIKMSEKQRQSLVDQIVKNKEMERSIESLKTVLQTYSLEAQNAADQTTAYIEGGNKGLRDEKRRQEIQAALRANRLDENSEAGQLLKESMLLKYRDQDRLALEQVLTPLTLATEQQDKLNEALKISSSAYRDAKREIDIHNEALSLNNGITDENLKLLETQIRLRKQSEEESPRIARNNEFNRQLTNNQELMDSLKQGVIWNPDKQQMEFSYYEEKIRYLERVKKIEAEGIPLSSDEGMEFMKNLKAIDDSNIALDNLMAKQQQMVQLGQQVGDAFGNAFFQMITGAQGFKASLAQLASQLAQIAFQRSFMQIIYSIAGFAFPGGGRSPMLTGGALAGSPGMYLPGHKHGAAFLNGNYTAFAKGGIVDRPSYFGMSSGRTGLMGEAGPEGILPLTRTSGGDLGVKMVGGNNKGGISVVNEIKIEVNSGAGGTDAEKEKFGKIIAKQVDAQVKAAVTQQLQEQGRIGNMLNPGMKM